MAVFNTFQNRHIYVAKAYDANVSETSAAGTIGGVKVISDGIDKELHFLYKGAESLMKSDAIQLKNLNYAKAINASDMAVGMKKVELVLDPNVNGGNPVSGQDYILRIAFRQFYGASDEHSYIKDAAVHANASMSASDFYNEMLDALNKAFSREVGANAKSNPYLAFSVDNASAATKIIIEEKPQEWTLGTQAQERVYFDVVPTTIYTNGDDLIWGKVTEIAPTTMLGNGKKIADLEWFCMGERGDQYRNIGWPNVIPTEYLVDPSKDYHVLELHFGFTDNGVNSYRSEKDITIVSDDDAVLNSLIGAINSATGLSIATL